MYSLILSFIIMLLLSGCVAQQGQNREQRAPSMQMNSVTPQTTNDFAQRWNSLLDTTGCPYKLLTLMLQEQNDTLVATTSLSEDIELQTVFTMDKKFKSLQITSSPSSKKERFLLLTTWTQAIMTVRPDVDQASISDLFHRFGIDVNGDLSDITDITISELDAKLSMKTNGTTIILSFTENDAP